MRFPLMLVLIKAAVLVKVGWEGGFARLRSPLLFFKSCYAACLMRTAGSASSKNLKANRSIAS